jgi:pimeloyl-ACP methyl ester carboxylesterase
MIGDPELQVVKAWTAHSLPIHSWNSMVPWVVSAGKFGASLPPQAPVARLGDPPASAPGVWWPAFDRAVCQHPPVEPWPVLPAIGCPALVIHGEKSARMDRAAAARVAVAIPRGAAATLPGACHHLQLDAPEAFAAAVDAWLDAGG